MATTSLTAPKVWPVRSDHMRGLLRSEWVFALALFITLRLVFSLFALIMTQSGTMPEPCLGGATAPTLHSGGVAYQSLGVWQRWDVCWFEIIATDGYPQQSGAVGFPPLFPLLMHTTGIALGENYMLGGMLVSAWGYVFAMVGLLKVVKLDFDEAIARRTALFLSIFPAAFYLFIPYAEALFLALVVWAFVFARRGQLLPAAALALLAALTRSPGILLMLPLAWEALRQWRAGQRKLILFFAPCLPPLGFLLYDRWAKLTTGWSYYEGIEVWKTVHMVPWKALSLSWHYVVAERSAPEAANLLLLVFMTCFLLLGLRDIPFSYSIFAGSQLVLISARWSEHTPLMSASLYLLVLFPIVIVLALRFRTRPSQVLWIVGSGGMLLYLTNLFLGGGFVA